MEYISTVVTLASSGLGFVAALAWNEAVKAAIDTYLTPYISPGSGVVSKFLYAVILTFLVVVIGHELGKLVQRSRGR